MPNNRFDALTPEQQEFLISYTKHRGELLDVAEELSIPGSTGYETQYNANMILLGIQRALGVPDKNYDNYVPTWPYTSVPHPKASDIVRSVFYHEKLSHGFDAPLVCYPLTYDYRYIYAYCTDAKIDCVKVLNSNKKETIPETYRYEILDMIVDLLLDNQGFAPKGSQAGKNAYAAGTLAGYYKTHHLDNLAVKRGEGRLSVYYLILKAAGIITDDKNLIRLSPQYWTLL